MAEHAGSKGPTCDSSVRAIDWSSSSRVTASRASALHTTAFAAMRRDLPRKSCTSRPVAAPSAVVILTTGVRR